jgi:hypothetical protein
MKLKNRTLVIEANRPFRIAHADKTNSNKGDIVSKGYVNFVSSQSNIHILTRVNSAAPSTPFRTDRSFISYTKVTSGPTQGPESSPINTAYTSSSPEEPSVYNTNSPSYPPPPRIADATRGASPQVPAAAPDDVLIQITVGPDGWRSVFLVSRNKLFQKAPMLAEQLKEHINKGRSPTAELPMEFPLAFEIFVRWLNHDLIINGNDEDRICKALMELFFFAERYCIYDLAGTSNARHLPVLNISLVIYCLNMSESVCMTCEHCINSKFYLSGQD